MIIMSFCFLIVIFLLFFPDSPGLSSISSPREPASLLQSLTENMDESRVANKMFSYALRPFELYPFFYRATNPPSSSKQISLNTLLSASRLDSLTAVARNWKGHMSITFHVSKKSKLEDIRSLQTALQKNPDLASNGDIHVVVDDLPYQFNLWRNIARMYSPSEYVIMLDVDFVPDAQLYDRLMENWEVMQRDMDNRKAFIIPAFQFKEGHERNKIPKKKAEMVKLLRQDKAELFHADWFPGHGFTDVEKWMNRRAEDGPYQVTKFDKNFEPYLIYSQKAPFCDEKFVGYGLNKCACVFEMYASGFSFYVLSDSFLFHRPHEGPLWDPNSRRMIETTKNRETMKRFMADLELRYGNRENYNYSYRRDPLYLKTLDKSMKQSS